MISIIATRELRCLFYSPLPWIMLGCVQFISAWLFFGDVDRFLQYQSQLAALPGAPGVTDRVIAPLFNIMSVVLLMMMPLVTMRLISEERRSGTLSLLRAAPISAFEIIIGKYFAVFVFIVITLGLLLLMPLSLQFGTQLDFGQMAGGLLGLMLLLTATGAIGLYLSCLTSQPAIAATSTFGILLILWIINGSSHAAPDTKPDVILNWLSIIHHQQNFTAGMINSADCIYYLLIIGLFLLLGIRQLENERLLAR